MTAPRNITFWLAVNESGDNRISWDGPSDAIGELQENDGAEATRVVEINVTIDLPKVETVNVAVTVPPEVKSPTQVTVS